MGDHEEGVVTTDDNEFGIGCGEHRDYGCLTFINSDDTRDCLEIKDADGAWHKVNVSTVDEDCFVVNIGDMLSLWSGGLYQSTPHRVLPPRAQNVCDASKEFNARSGSNIGRVSVPFFYEPNWETVIRPIELDMDQQHTFAWDEKDRIKWKATLAFRESAQPVMFGDHL